MKRGRLASHLGWEYNVRRVVERIAGEESG
jgi:hypothetical protein